MYFFPTHYCRLSLFLPKTRVLKLILRQLKGKGRTLVPLFAYMAKDFTQSMSLLILYRLCTIKKQESSCSSDDSENEQEQVLQR